MTRFIKLTLSASGKSLYLDPFEIKAFAQETNYSEIVCKYGTGAYHVKETTEEILALLNPPRETKNA